MSEEVYTVRRMGTVRAHDGEPYTVFEVLRDGEPTGQTWETVGVVTAEEAAAGLNDAEQLLARAVGWHRATTSTAEPEIPGANASPDEWRRFLDQQLRRVVREYRRVLSNPDCPPDVRAECKDALRQLGSEPEGVA